MTAVAEAAGDRLRRCGELDLDSLDLAGFDAVRGGPVARLHNFEVGYPMCGIRACRSIVSQTGGAVVEIRLHAVDAAKRAA